jgi:hypothetical protein
VTEPARLHPDDVEAVARRVVEMLRDGGRDVGDRPAGGGAAGAAPDAGPRTLSARQIADRYGVSPDWVRRNRDRLGVVALGEPGAGRRPRLRFDAAAVERALTASRPGGETEFPASSAAPPRRQRSRSRPPATDLDLLPVRGFNTPPPSKSGGRRANGPAPATGGTS